MNYFYLILTSVCISIMPANAQLFYWLDEIFSEKSIEKNNFKNSSKMINFEPIRFEENFPRTPLIKLQVEFWKKMFTYYSDQQTLIHDKNNPEIIYLVINHQNYEHFKRKKLVKTKLNEVTKALVAISKKNKKNLNSFEKEIFSKIPTIYLNNLSSLAHHVRYQQGMSNNFKRGLERSFAYMKYIREIFIEMDLPIALGYLPLVESSFNYQAYSRVGAAGIWQFMSGSAKHFKLKVSGEIDQRLDPILATQAAAQMLKNNYKILDSWPLAITAYNHGPYGIKRASNRLNTTDLETLITDYRSGSFNFASKNFYASFIAAIDVAREASVYFPDLAVDEEINFKKIIIDKPIKINDFLKKDKLSLDVFKKYNPFIMKIALRKNILLPKKTIIYIPQK